MRLQNNRSLPRNTFIPVLNYPDIHAAAAWLCVAFEFRERLRIADHRVQLNVAGEGLVVRRGVPPAPTLERSAQTVIVRVDDVKSHHRRSIRTGACVVSSPTRYPYGEYQYTVMDPWGHVWTFSETIADRDPASWGGVLLDVSGEDSFRQGDAAVSPAKREAGVDEMVR